MKLFQTSQNEVINTSMITNIKPIHNREVGKETAERLYTKEEYHSIINAQDVKKCRVVNQDVLWGQVYYPIVAYKVTTTNGLVIISVPDYDRLIKTLSDWLTDDSGEDKYYDDKSVEAVDEHTAKNCPLTQAVFYGAPDDIEYAAMDRNGEVYWYKEEPTISSRSTVWGALDSDTVIPDTPNWERSCIKRKR